MLVEESLVAFLIIMFVAILIYLISRRAANKTPHSEEQSSMYACGEKMESKRLLVNVSLYKYLIYFVIIDSPALIVAFAALALEIINSFHLLIYLGIVLAANFLLLGGKEDA
jgi:NADH:ubiquinone oxidoreductase subunit 3 (subunit A)